MKSTELNVTLTIGEAAARFGLATHVLRHWESMGLLSPRRNGDRRRYGEEDLYRIALVVRGKQAGLSLEDIAELHQARGGAARKQILRQQRTALLKRIAEAQAALELIDHGLGCPHEDLLECTKFRHSVAELVDLTVPGS
ncbi:MerR family transcriptional regulator [Stackebrandtia nassauensis]|uniref:Transcriptional regulator, MerR family n=1 Tax=Stackebrandtia nassauensis (strain DSM 44728 / CIP 108903 / NRRL B-16338 / NBRC 102104 / LLR-40K-21) TaxID=446470 RepID=D3PYZ4_STANL|nr:MerR family transcriptional regulator [Stackebrandtia nassauensis]ADD45423.1 transcriptional regulator, MerR family [Stackebrandtia nassauensis DSM 44728]